VVFVGTIEDPAPRNVAATEGLEEVEDGLCGLPFKLEGTFAHPTTNAGNVRMHVQQADLLATRVPVHDLQCTPWVAVRAQAIGHDTQRMLARTPVPIVVQARPGSSGHLPLAAHHARKLRHWVAGLGGRGLHRLHVRALVPPGGAGGQRGNEGQGDKAVMESHGSARSMG
jgi:hypothetical protein